MKLMGNEIKFGGSKMADKHVGIVLIDDHKLFREGVKRILDLEEGFEILAEGDDGSVAAKLVKEHNPDVVLMDINMPHINGVQATADLVRYFPDTRVIILSIHDDERSEEHTSELQSRD